MEPKLSKKVLFTFFSGHATPLQKKLIEEWLREEKNIEIFYQRLEEWEAENPQFIPDTERALGKFVSRMTGETPSVSQADTPESPLSRSRAPRLRYGVAAAVVLLCLATGFFFRDFLVYQTYATAYGEIKTVTLSDGSRVTLNAHSALRVPRFGFGKTSRKVQLEGEAEFVVMHTPDHQRFVVVTPNQVEVEVLGTEFIVDAHAKGTQVVLSKGKVQLKSLRQREKQPIAMRPGDVVKVDAQGKFSILSSQSLDEYTAWKDHRFVFNATSLREIAGRIQETYGVEVVIPDSSLANRTITGTYHADNAEELLQVLSEVLNMQLLEHRKKIILTQSQSSY